MWWDSLPGPITRRAPLSRDLDVDVAVVGAGYTGLWTALSLALADSRLRIAVLEAEVAGFGASGRNGGWCSAFFSLSDARMVRRHGLQAARRMRRAMQAAVDEVGRATTAAGVDCHFDKGGAVVVARDDAQLARAKARVEGAKELGVGGEDLRWLEAAEATELFGATRVLGATYTPHCAAVQPALLARGLADAAERHGVAVYEGTPVLTIDPGRAGHRPRAVTPMGSVRADVVVRALEAWTADFPGEHRTLAPLYSMMIATEPLGETFWKEAGLDRRETFADHRHFVIYGQRTADGRIAFGGDGVPYHFGSRVRERFDNDAKAHDAIRRVLVDLLPAVGDVAITHRWGGPIGMPRDWHASVGLDRSTGVAWAGGYVGDGVSTANLAGRTLADLVVGEESDLVTLPWVGHRSKPWETEPLRWLGINAGERAASLADALERRRGRPSWLADRIDRLVGE